MLEYEWSYGKFKAEVEILLNIPGKFKAEVEILLKEFMDDIADFTEEQFRDNVPIGASPEGGRTQEHISGNVEKTKYGFALSVGVEPISTLKPGEDPQYPIYVHGGTGHFNPFEPHDILPANGNIMQYITYSSGPFFGPGDVIKTRFTKGQEAQPYLDRISREVNAYIRVKKRELSAKIVNIIKR